MTDSATMKAGKVGGPEPAGRLEPMARASPGRAPGSPAAPLPGILYVIATPPAPDGLHEARRLAALLGAERGGARAGVEDDRTLPGALWGWRPGTSGAASGEAGNRISVASSGPREAILWGDPAWLEPLSGRPCDAAELLRAWDREGPRAARLLDNLFLAVVADRASGQVSIITDLTGGIRLFSARIGPRLVLCTSYLAVSRLAGAGAVDGEAIAAFFHLGYFPGRRTALRDVAVHPFASVTTVKEGRVEIEPYWRPQMAIDRSRPAAGVLDEAVHAFNATVREYASGFDRMHLAMTAGLDSRAVASSLIRQRIPFETYTHGFPGCWEEKRVRKIVGRHGIPHRFVPLSDGFTKDLAELALASFRATEGEISCIEKSHLIRVFTGIRADGAGHRGLLLGGGAGMLKGTYYRLLEDEEPYTQAGVDRYIVWNLSKRLPDIFDAEIPIQDPRVLRDFVTSALDETEGGSFFQKLDYFYLTRYRRWAGVVKNIYRGFFPVREPFVSARMLRLLFPMDPAIKNAKLPHFAVLERNYPEIRYDLTNKMTPALPLNARTFHRFLPSILWRTKQVLRGVSRRYLPFELFPLADFVDYGSWIQSPSGRGLLDELLDPRRMKSAFLYDDDALRGWIEGRRREGFPFALADRMCTIELYFREVRAP